MNKIGKTKGTTIFFGVLALVAVLAMVYAVFGGGLFKEQSVISTTGATAAPAGGVAVTYDTGTGTTLSFTAADAVDSGTSVAATSYVKLPGAEFATAVTKASAGNAIEVLMLNNTIYHNGILKATVPFESVFGKAIKLNKNSSVTLVAYSDDGITVLTDSTSGGAYNETASAKTYNHKLTMTGTSKASTQDMTCIMEVQNKTSLANVEVTGSKIKGIAVIPQTYTTTANTFLKVYEVSPIVGSEKAEFNIQIQASTTNAGGWAKWTCLTKEDFIGANGALAYAVEDTSATPVSAKSIATYTRSWLYQ